MNEKLLPIPVRQKHVGKHLVLDAWRVSGDLLNDASFMRQALRQAVDRCGATLVNLCVHQFSPYGVTATATLAESHMAVHSWPEHGYLGADLFFCGEGRPEQALETLLQLDDALCRPGGYHLAQRLHVAQQVGRLGRQPL